MEKGGRERRRERREERKEGRKKRKKGRKKKGICVSEQEEKKICHKMLI